MFGLSGLVGGAPRAAILPGQTGTFQAPFDMETQEALGFRIVLLDRATALAPPVLEAIRAFLSNQPVVGWADTVKLLHEPLPCRA